MTQPLDTRQLAKLAVIIHSKLTESPSDPPQRDLPELSWLQLRRELRRLRLAQKRGWQHSIQSLQRDLHGSLERLVHELQMLLPHFQADLPREPASAHEIYRDLLALEEEFPDVRWLPQHQTLSVTTDAITLEGKYLGPFQIELSLRQLLPHPTYFVSAEDPQAPAMNTDVSHPHVQGTELCEGEGTLMIRAAIREGRLLDFFLIVRNILGTYNPSSAYVGLDEWDGVRCRECDYSMDEDESRCCHRCETTLCSECARHCCDCTETTCSNCSRLCNGCDDDVCRSCVKACRDCQESYCSNCLSDDERCPDCHETFQEQANHETADAALQPL